METIGLDFGGLFDGFLEALLGFVSQLLNTIFGALTGFFGGFLP